MTALAKHSSASNEHFTPREYVAAASAAMGGIDLDPASCKEANRIVGARCFFAEGDDGFAQEWHGCIFLNPPGGCVDRNGRPSRTGDSNAKRWWFKLCAEHRAGRVSDAVFLGFNLEILQTTQTPCRYSDLPVVPLTYADALCFPRQRISFVEARTMQPQRQPTHANVIAYLGTRRVRFAEAFSLFGDVVLP